MVKKTPEPAASTPTSAKAASKAAPAAKVAKAPAKAATKQAATTSTAKSAATKAPAKEARPTVAAKPEKPAAKPAAAKAHAKAAAKPAAKAEKAPAKAPAPAAKAAEKTPSKAGTPAAKSPAKVAKAPETPAVPAAKAAPSFDTKFLDGQRKLLLEERARLLGQSVSLENEAAALMNDLEPGDVQFDDESGEGDSIVVERERDLALAAQARDTVAAIDAALARLDSGTYGFSVISGRAIPRERLRAIPWATELVEEKVGGLGTRR